MIPLKQLKSGTDIRGKATSEPGNPATLSEGAVFRISRGFADFVKRRKGNHIKIAVGGDCRLTSDKIKRTVIGALYSAGAEVFDCGLSSTPAMFMTTVTGGMTASIQVTASHHPADRNGLKFFLPEGGLSSDELDEVIDLAEKHEFLRNQRESAPQFPFMDRYCEHLRRVICGGLKKSESEKPLAGMHIVLDAGNGVGGFYSEKVLIPLGADTSGSVYLTPDGSFPNHIPNPENEDAMKSIRSAVISSGADLGVIFDTDVDRAACVGKDGEEINRNRLIALVSAIVLESEPGSTIVTDSVTSDGLSEFITSLGGRHHRFKRGYKNVIDEARRLTEAGENAPLAIETSGHAALKENYYLDDGAYLMTKIITEAVKLRREGKDITDLISALRCPAEEHEYRLTVTAGDFSEYADGVLRELEKFSRNNGEWRVANDSYEGVRVSTREGCFIMRKSVHDPILVLNTESDRPGGTAVTLSRMRAFLETYEKLDISAIES